MQFHCVVDWYIVRLAYQSIAFRRSLMHNSTLQVKSASSPFIVGELENKDAPNGMLEFTFLTGECLE